MRTNEPYEPVEHCAGDVPTDSSAAIEAYQLVQY